MKLKLSITIIAILLALISSSYVWYKAESYAITIQESDYWYYDISLSREVLRDEYDLGFKKIILLDIFVFASAFLLIKAFSDKK